MSDLVFNGINAATGDYLLPPLPAEVIGQIARGEELEERPLPGTPLPLNTEEQDYLGPKAGVDPNKLEEAGWGVIFTHDASLAVREALLPLLNRRQSQAGKYYREFSPFVACRGLVKTCKGLCGYRTAESKVAFPCPPRRRPRTGRPGEGPLLPPDGRRPGGDPLRFQYQLDVQYAVGRLCFDTLDEYGATPRAWSRQKGQL